MNRTQALRLHDYLLHVLDGIERISRYTAGFDEAAFAANSLVQDAVLRNLEVIGEACHNVARHHAEFAAQHAEVPWRFAYEMRNALAHGYFQVDHAIVWRTLKNDLPDLAEKIRPLLSA
jgi:uncharacterized protein with HEPN domain